MKLQTLWLVCSIFVMTIMFTLFGYSVHMFSKISETSLSSDHIESKMKCLEQNLEKNFNELDKKLENREYIVDFSDEEC